MKLEQVYQKEGKYYIDIFYHFKSFPYRLSYSKDLKAPLSILHLSNELCPVCLGKGRGSYKCTGFSTVTLFNKLIQMNSIRLYWLYLKS